MKREILAGAVALSIAAVVGGTVIFVFRDVIFVEKVVEGPECLSCGYVTPVTVEPVVEVKPVVVEKDPFAGLPPIEAPPKPRRPIDAPIEHKTEPRVTYVPPKPPEPVYV